MPSLPWKLKMENEKLKVAVWEAYHVWSGLPVGRQGTLLFPQPQKGTITLQLYAFSGQS